MSEAEQARADVGGALLAEGLRGLAALSRDMKAIIKGLAHRGR